VWLPLAGWNGKFLGVGSFGWAGALMLPGMLTGIEQGYANATTDTGHDSSTPQGNGGRFTRIVRYEILRSRERQLITSRFEASVVHRLVAGLEQKSNGLLSRLRSAGGIRTVSIYVAFLARRDSLRSL
jgi:hypothetical protein